MKQLVYGIATRNWAGSAECVASWLATASEPYPEFRAENMHVPAAFQYIYENTTEPIIALIHDDLRILEQDWDKRILEQFDDPSVGLIGFGGGLGHFLPQAYVEPFHIPNMIRREFLSNLVDAERHGRRFTGECDVAVLDGIALFIRRSVLDRWGGWPVSKPYGYFLYSEALCCEVRRQGLRIRVVGISCEHLGGKTIALTQLTENYEEAHRALWEDSRDVLPYFVEE